MNGPKAKAIAQACDNATQREKVFEEKIGLKLTPIVSAKVGLDGGGLVRNFYHR